MNFINDKELKYKSEVLKYLREYNKSKTGPREQDSFNVYLFQGNKLIAGITTEYSWDWVYITTYFYEDINILNILVNELKKYYKGKQVAICTSTSIPEIQKEYYELGFQNMGEITNMPKGFNHAFIVDYVSKPIDIDHKYTIKTSNELIDEYKDEYNELFNQYFEMHLNKYGMSNIKIEKEFVCLEKEEFVGGVYGYLKNDYLYVSLLVVREEYRGKDIATKLMNLIEEDAKLEGYDNAYLGTCTFQAKDFYLKRGYELAYIVKDDPRGFDEFVLTKKL